MIFPKLMHLLIAQWLVHNYFFPSCRFFRENHATHGAKISALFNGDEKREHGSGRKSGPLLSGTAYCISSCSMILLNKVVLSSYNFDAGISLMLYQVCWCQTASFFLIGSEK